MTAETPKLPSFTMNKPHEGPESIYCLKMEPRKFDNANDDTTY